MMGFIFCYILSQLYQMQKTDLHPLSLQRIENIFFLNGITALLGWNAALGALDYFSYVYSGYNVYLYFPIPVFIAYAITGVLFNTMSLKFTYTQIVKTGIIGLNACLVLLLLISIVYKGKEETGVGFGLTLFTGFLLGFFNNLAQLSFFAMINYFGMQTVSRFTIGTAASGLMVIILRAIITGIFGDDQSNIAPIIIYFCLSIAFNFFDLILNIRMFKTQEYIEKIEGSKNASNEVQQSIISEDRQKQREKQRITAADSSAQTETKSYATLMYQSFKATTPYPLFIFFDFVVTFMLFPSLTLAKKTSLGTVWTSIIMLLMYNIGDFAGKLIGDFRGSFNSRSITYLFFCRLYFFFTIPLMDKQFTQEDHLLNNNIFPFFNQVMFAFTNGLVINGSFILSFEKAPTQYKKYAGVLGGIFLQFGIMVGTFLAIPLQKIVDPDL